MTKAQQVDVKWWSVNLLTNNTKLLTLDLQKISRHREAAGNVIQPSLKFPFKIFYFIIGNLKFKMYSVQVFKPPLVGTPLAVNFSVNEICFNFHFYS